MLYIQNHSDAPRTGVLVDSVSDRFRTIAYSRTGQGLYTMSLDDPSRSSVEHLNTPEEFFTALRGLDEQGYLAVRHRHIVSHYAPGAWPIIQAEFDVPDSQTDTETIA